LDLRPGVAEERSSSWRDELPDARRRAASMNIGRTCTLLDVLAELSSGGIAPSGAASRRALRYGLSGSCELVLGEVVRALKLEVVG
jgi:hypothetical protein